MTIYAVKQLNNILYASKIHLIVYFILSLSLPEMAGCIIAFRINWYNNEWYCSQLHSTEPNHGSNQLARYPGLSGAIGHGLLSYTNLYDCVRKTGISMIISEGILLFGLSLMTINSTFMPVIATWLVVGFESTRLILSG